MTVKLIEQTQYDERGVKVFLIFYINEKKEGSAFLYESRKWELPADKKSICDNFNPIVDNVIEITEWEKEAEIEEDNITDWLNSFGYDKKVIGKLY